MRFGVLSGGRCWRRTLPMAKLLLFIGICFFLTGTLLPVVIGQNCELVFSIRKLRNQNNAVHVSGLIALELSRSGRVTGNQLTCTCKRGKRNRLAHWVGPNGTVANDPTSHVFYKLARRCRGTAVKLRIEQRQSFACSDAGEYTCIIGKSNRTAVLRPINKDCSPADVAVRATPSGPLVRGASLILQCLAVNPTHSGLTYQWLKDGQLVAEEASALLVRSAVEEEDSGVYTCQVSNRVGEGEANVTVTVITSPVSPSPSPSPPLEPPTCAPRVTLSQMCASLNNFKNQTLSLATSGDCTTSDDCLNLQCSFMSSFSGFAVPFRENMTLLPCTSPYSFGLVVSSSLLGGDLVNGVFFESSDVDFTALGLSGTVAITVVQQEFGVTVAIDVIILGSRVPILSQTDLYMHCANGCPSSSPTLPTSTVLPSPSPSPFPSPSPSPPLEPPTCPPRVTLSQMCASLNRVTNQTLSLASSGGCTISKDCLNLQCSYTSSFSGFAVPFRENMTLLPCISPYSFGLVVSSSLLGGDLVSGVFSESSNVSFTALGFSGIVVITVVQQEFGVTIAVDVIVLGNTLPIISRTDLYMHCAESCPSSSPTLPTSTVLPSPSPSPSPPLEPPTCAPRVTLTQMCASLNRVKNQTLSLATSGDCTMSKDCLNLQCSFMSSFSGFAVPFRENMTLLPCTSPYSFGLVVSSSFLGDLVNGVFSESSDIDFTALGFSGTVAVTVVQQEFGVTIAVDVIILGSTVPILSQTDVYMHCANGCPSSSPTLPTSTVLPSPSPSPFPSPSPSPPLEPSTCPPRVTLSQMCASLNSVKNQTLSLATSGDCTMSKDCLNLQCSFITSFSGFTVPVRENMTLLPCTSPYSFGLVVSSSLLGGDLANGVFSESRDIDFTALGFPGTVAITVVQQEFGVTTAVDVIILGNTLPILSQTDLYMHCADSCPSSSPTLSTSTSLQSPSPSPSPSPPLEPPTCVPRVTLSQMCDSLNNLKTQTLSTATSGDCTISDDCLDLQCSFVSTFSNNAVPINMNMTLLPCASPYSVDLQVVSPGVLGELVNGVYSETSRVPFYLFGVEGAVDITVVQQSYGVTVSVQAVVLGQTLTVIEQTDVYMHCADGCPSSSLTLPTSTALPSSSPSPSPPLEPPTCAPRVTLTQMCASLNRVKNQTLSLASSGDCTISKDCLNLQCSFTSSFSGFAVPFRENMTLHPCTSPYSFGLVVSSSFLGDLVNGVFSESSDIDFTALGFSGTVAVTVVQQEFGVTIAVDVIILGSTVPILSQTDLYMHCADSCPSSSPTLSTSTSLPSPSPSPPPSPPLEPPTCVPRVTLSQMCASFNNLKTQTLSTATSGDCTISDNCLNLKCAFNTTFLNIDVPVNMNMTLLPCTSPYSVELQVVSPGALGELVNGVYSETSRVPFSVSGFEGAVDITVVQQSYGVTVSVQAMVLGQMLTVIEQTDVYMHCADICAHVTTTLPPSTALPSPSPSPSPPLEPPTCAPRVSLSQMCASLNNFKNQTLSLATSGDCIISNNCLNVQCSFNAAFSGFAVPVRENMTLLPCTSPYSFELVVSSSLLGDLVNGVFSESSNVSFTTFGTSGIVTITVVQQEFGVTIAVDAIVLANTLPIISRTDIYMHCGDICSDLTPTLPASTAPPSPSPSPSPPLEPPTCAPRVTLSQMCDSLNSFKTQTLSVASSGDCTISANCLNVQCSFTATFSGFAVPVRENMTLLPCTSPYSFGLVVSSTALGGNLVNGVFSKSSNVSFTAFGTSGTVAITVVQQEFGVTIAVDAIVLGNTLPIISQTDLYMHCAGRCPA